MFHIKWLCSMCESVCSVLGEMQRNRESGGGTNLEETAHMECAGAGRDGGAGNDRKVVRTGCLQNQASAEK